MGMKKNIIQNWQIGDQLLCVPSRNKQAVLLLDQVYIYAGVRHDGCGCSASWDKKRCLDCYSKDGGPMVRISDRSAYAYYSPCRFVNLSEVLR